LKNSVWLYFLCAFAWSWFFWIPTALWGPDASHRMTQIGFGLGGLGPPIFGAYFTFKNDGPKAFQDYLRRIWDWRYLKPFWWAFALFLLPALSAAAGLADWLLGGQGIQLNFQIFHSHLPLVFSVPMTLAFLILFGPLPEEMGWRGYALDRLQWKMGPWGASLLLGFFWGLWHLPLFYLKGSYQSTLGVGTIGFWLFMGEVVSVAPLMTWIYNRTDRSILSAILFHFACNFTGTVSLHADRLEIFQILFCVLWILGVAVAGKDWSLGWAKARKISAG
jgi:membrane protease YdiL (CAAX protease family)